MRDVYLLEETISRGLGNFSKHGALVVSTGKKTGRSTNERFIVRRPEIEDKVHWGKVNQPMEPAKADEFFSKIEAKLAKEDQKFYGTKGYCGPFPIEVKSFSPWHVIFANNMFRDTCISTIKEDVPNPETIRVYHDPFSKVSDYGIDWQYDVAIILDLHQSKIMVIGTEYAGEIKKGAFTMANFKLPEYGIMPMHSSANCLADGENSSIMFGLSGTGKTTLSAVADRPLVGDDEIVWTKRGLSNLEGGCYAKLIDLTEEKEPEIYHAVNKFGAIMENIVLDQYRMPEFHDQSKTENTRGSYPIESLDHVFDQNRECKPPKSIVFLTADAFGALPAVAKLDFYQAQYHFVSGYTAKVAGTEIGVTEPEAAFSACFGAPFMPRHASEYAAMLADLAEKYDVSVYMLNTGWTGGDYNTGARFPIKVSRAILAAIQNGQLDNVEFVKHPVFGFKVPTECPGVDGKWLKAPEGPAVAALGKKFKDNIAKYADKMRSDVIEKGGPRAVSNGVGASSDRANLTV